MDTPPGWGEGIVFPKAEPGVDGAAAAAKDSALSASAMLGDVDAEGGGMHTQSGGSANIISFSTLVDIDSDDEAEAEAEVAAAAAAAAADADEAAAAAAAAAEDDIEAVLASEITRHTSVHHACA